ncbi:uncharacterized protein LOC101239050 isoform X2 [Hydra vulgaris]|uniref:Uncharacterized protein LOC101239050 isoform X2 n=1 Tax=Hydra vulgaris TaxID=6087 RepID=A0ABM4BRI0_HYDVU
MFALLPILLIMGIFGTNFEYAKMSYTLKHSPSTREKNSSKENNSFSPKNFLNEPLLHFPRVLKENVFTNSVQFKYPGYLKLNNIDDKLSLIFTKKQFSNVKNTLKHKKSKPIRKINKRSHIKNKKNRIGTTNNLKKYQKSSKRMEMFIVDETQLDDSPSAQDSQLDDENDEYDNEEPDDESNGYVSEKDAGFSDVNQKYKLSTAVNSYTEADNYENPKEENYLQYATSKKPSLINSEPTRDVMLEGLSTPFMESTQLIKANQMRGNYISVGNSGNKNKNPLVDESAASFDNVIKKEAFKAQIDNSIKQKIFEDIAKDAALRDEFSKNMTEFDLDQVDYDEFKKQKSTNQDSLLTYKIPTFDGQIFTKEPNLLNNFQNMKMQGFQEKPGYSYLVLPENNGTSKIEGNTEKINLLHNKQAKVIGKKRVDADDKNEPAATGDFANIVEKADQEVINSSLKFQNSEKHKETVDKTHEEQPGIHLKTIFSPTLSQLSSLNAFIHPQSDPFSLEAPPSVNEKLFSKMEQKQEMDPLLENHNILDNQEEDQKIQNFEPPTKIFVPSKDSSDIHSITPTDQLLEMLSKGQFNHPMSDDELTKLSSFDPNKQYLDDQKLNPTQFSQNNFVHFGETFVPSNGINPIESIKTLFSEKHLESSNPNAPSAIKTDPAFLGQNIHLLDPTKFRTFDDLNKISEGMIHAHVVSIKHPSQKHYSMQQFIHLPHIETPFPTSTIQRVFEDALETPYKENVQQDTFTISHLLKYGKAISNNHCHTSPCQNGGLCTPHPHGFRCSCKLGWIGEMCSKRSSCTPNPCVHGICSPNTDGHTCTCKKGFKGQQCQEVDRCYPNPCSNNGVCAETMHKVQCECLPGFKGSLCQLEAKCAPINPCLNGGICQEFFAHYHCQCLSMYQGQNCEVLLVPTRAPTTLLPKYSGPQAIPMPLGNLNLYPLHSEVLDHLSQWESSRKKALYVVDKMSKQYSDKKELDYNALSKNNSNIITYHSSNIVTYNKDNKLQKYNKDNEKSNFSVSLNHKINNSSFFEKMSLLLGGKGSSLSNVNTKNYSSKGIGNGLNNTLKISNKKDEKAKVRTIDNIYKDKSIFLKENFIRDVNKNSLSQGTKTKKLNRNHLMIEDADSNNEVNNMHPSSLAEKLKILDKRVFKNLPSNKQSDFIIEGFNQYGKITYQENGKQRSVVNRKPKINYQQPKYVGQSQIINLTKGAKIPLQMHNRVMKNSFKKLNKYGCPSFCGYFCDPWCIKVGCCKATSDQLSVFKEIEKEHLKVSQNKQSKGTSLSKACIKCNENADCLVNRCVCKTGFHGNGIICKVDICVLCHLDADCIHQKCFCKNGFIGDGFNCKPGHFSI